MRDTRGTGRTLGLASVLVTLLGCGSSGSPAARSGGAAGGGLGGGVAGQAGADAGAAGAGGAGGALVGSTSASWAAWPMPNGPVDVAAGAPNPMSYVVNPDGTVSDQVTGLLWQQDTGRADTWANALTRCPTLTLGGRNDWRLPAVIELLSLVDDSESPLPAIDPKTFPATQPDSYWTSSPVAGRDEYAWVVGFDGGSPSAGYKTFELYIRCVAGGPRISSDAGAGRYAIAGGTVRDVGTHLTWPQAIPPIQYDWRQAKADCSGLPAMLGLQGSGWRLPTKKELFTLIDFSVAGAAPPIDATAFPGTPAVHNYGHGAAGYTLSWGSEVRVDPATCARILDDARRFFA